MGWFICYTDPGIFPKTLWHGVCKGEEMNLTSKVFCIVVLMCSFLLILATGRSNVKNYEHVQTAIAEIYEDRLVVKGLIFELSSLLHEKEVAAVSGNATFFARDNHLVNQAIDEHLESFRETKLTEKEEATLTAFTKGIEQLKTTELENTFSSSGTIPESQSKKIKHQLHQLKAELITLSEIQLSEGKQKLNSAKQAVKQMNQFANLEYFALIILGVLMAGVLLVPRKKVAD